MTDSGGTVKWRTLLADLALLATVGILITLLQKTMVPFRRGFFCEDETIRFPIVAHPTFNSKTISAITLGISITTVTLVTIKLILFLVSSFVVILIVYYFWGLVLLILLVAVPPKRRGFFCEDESIRYPFHPSTIPNYALYIFGFTIPLSVIVITEVLSNRKVRSSGLFLFRPAPLWVLCLYKSLIDFLFGCVASQLVTDVGKYTIGRLRPNFIDVCGPKVGRLSLDVKDCSAFNHTYIQDYVCENSNNDAAESRVSFPSGHSSFSAYTMLYVAIFVQVKWVSRKTTLRLYKAGFQLSVILLSYFTALSRVMDNKHHWSDVLAGGLIGSITACLIARYVSGLTATRKDSSDNNGKGFHDLTSVGGGPSSDIEAGRNAPPKTQSVSTTRQSLDLNNA